MTESYSSVHNHLYGLAEMFKAKGRFAALLRDQQDLLQWEFVCETLLWFAHVNYVDGEIIDAYLDPLVGKDNEKIGNLLEILPDMSTWQQGRALFLMHMAMKRGRLTEKQGRDLTDWIGRNWEADNKKTLRRMMVLTLGGIASTSYVAQLRGRVSEILESIQREPVGEESWEEQLSGDVAETLLMFPGTRGFDKAFAALSAQEREKILQAYQGVEVESEFDKIMAQMAPGYVRRIKNLDPQQRAAELALVRGEAVSAVPTEGLAAMLSRLDAHLGGYSRDELRNVRSVKELSPEVYGALSAFYRDVTGEQGPVREAFESYLKRTSISDMLSDRVLNAVKLALTEAPVGKTETVWANVNQLQKHVDAQNLSGRQMAGALSAGLQKMFGEAVNEAVTQVKEIFRKKGHDPETFQFAVFHSGSVARGEGVKGSDVDSWVVYDEDGSDASVEFANALAEEITQRMAKRGVRASPILRGFRRGAALADEFEGVSEISELMDMTVNTAHPEMLQTLKAIRKQISEAEDVTEKFLRQLKEALARPLPTVAGQEKGLMRNIQIFLWWKRLQQGVPDALRFGDVIRELVAKRDITESQGQRLAEAFDRFLDRRNGRPVDDAPLAVAYARAMDVIKSNIASQAAGERAPSATSEEIEVVSLADAILDKLDEIMPAAAGVTVRPADSALTLPLLRRLERGPAWLTFFTVPLIRLLLAPVVEAVFTLPIAALSLLGFSRTADRLTARFLGLHGDMTEFQKQKRQMGIDWITRGTAVGAILGAGFAVAGLVFGMPLPEFFQVLTSAGVGMRVLAATLLGGLIGNIFGGHALYNAVDLLKGWGASLTVGRTVSGRGVPVEEELLAGKEKYGDVLDALVRVLDVSIAGAKDEATAETIRTLANALSEWKNPYTPAAEVEKLGIKIRETLPKLLFSDGLPSRVRQVFQEAKSPEELGTKLEVVLVELLRPTQVARADAFPAKTQEPLRNLDEQAPETEAERLERTMGVVPVAVEVEPLSVPIWRTLEADEKGMAQEKIRILAAPEDFNGGYQNFKRQNAGRPQKILLTKTLSEDMLGYAHPGPSASLADLGRLPAEPEKIRQLGIRDYILASETKNGTNAVVRLGSLNGRPVAVKAYYTRPDLDALGRENEMLRRDYRGAKAAELLGVGPRVHGVYTDSNGRQYLVTDVVAGDFLLNMQAAVSPATIVEYVDMMRRLSDAGLTPKDVQFLVSADGHIRLIDAAELFYEDGRTSPVPVHQNPDVLRTMNVMLAMLPSDGDRARARGLLGEKYPLLMPTAAPQKLFLSRFLGPSLYGTVQWGPLLQGVILQHKAWAEVLRSVFASLPPTPNNDVLRELFEEIVAKKEMSRETAAGQVLALLAESADPLILPLGVVEAVFQVFRTAENSLAPAQELSLDQLGAGKDFKKKYADLLAALGDVSLRVVRGPPIAGVSTDDFVTFTEEGYTVVHENTLAQWIGGEVPADLGKLKIEKEKRQPLLEDTLTALMHEALEKLIITGAQRAGLTIEQVHMVVEALGFRQNNHDDSQKHRDSYLSFEAKAERFLMIQRAMLNAEEGIAWDKLLQFIDAKIAESGHGADFDRVKHLGWPEWKMVAVRSILFEMAERETGDKQKAEGKGLPAPYVLPAELLAETVPEGFYENLHNRVFGSRLQVVSVSPADTAGLAAPAVTAVVSFAHAAAAEVVENDRAGALYREFWRLYLRAHPQGPVAEQGKRIAEIVRSAEIHEVGGAGYRFYEVRDVSGQLRIYVGGKTGVILGVSFNKAEQDAVIASVVKKVQSHLDHMTGETFERIVRYEQAPQCNEMLAKDEKLGVEFQRVTAEGKKEKAAPAQRPAAEPAREAPRGEAAGMMAEFTAAMSAVASGAAGEWDISRLASADVEKLERARGIISRILAALDAGDADVARLLSAPGQGRWMRTYLVEIEKALYIQLKLIFPFGAGKFVVSQAWIPGYEAGNEVILSKPMTIEDAVVAARKKYLAEKERPAAPVRPVVAVPAVPVQKPAAAPVQQKPRMSAEAMVAEYNAALDVIAPRVGGQRDVSRLVTADVKDLERGWKILVAILDAVDGGDAEVLRLVRAPARMQAYLKEIEKVLYVKLGVVSRWEGGQFVVVQTWKTEMREGEEMIYSAPMTLDEAVAAARKVYERSVSLPASAPAVQPAPLRLADLQTFDDLFRYLEGLGGRDVNGMEVKDIIQIIQGVRGGTLPAKLVTRGGQDPNGPFYGLRDKVVELMDRESPRPYNLVHNVTALVVTVGAGLLAAYLGVDLPSWFEWMLGVYTGLMGLHLLAGGWVRRLGWRARLESPEAKVNARLEQLVRSYYGA
ncbi:MAG TPA: DUF294 nucleotidyltransferase-like domain-containing protein, partial [Elusimicrobiota bacterium]|nr:DUF294 nucleotidyltransferase-like domain-containing protein [Elusimicrobiota bacterium]